MPNHFIQPDIVIFLLFHVFSWVIRNIMSFVTKNHSSSDVTSFHQISLIQLALVLSSACSLLFQRRPRAFSEYRFECRLLKGLAGLQPNKLVGIFSHQTVNDAQEGPGVHPRAG